jgi:hypothetical protein
MCKILGTKSTDNKHEPSQGVDPGNVPGGIRGNVDLGFMIIARLLELRWKGATGTEMIMSSVVGKTGECLPLGERKGSNPSSTGKCSTAKWTLPGSRAKRRAT